MWGAGQALPGTTRLTPGATPLHLAACEVRDQWRGGAAAWLRSGPARHDGDGVT